MALLIWITVKARIIVLKVSRYDPIMTEYAFGSFRNWNFLKFRFRRRHEFVVLAFSRHFDHTFHNFLNIFVSCVYNFIICLLSSRSWWIIFLAKPNWAFRQNWRNFSKRLRQAHFAFPFDGEFLRPPYAE